MKKYNTPEIVALALETVDVIETSGNYAAAEELGSSITADVKVIEENIGSMSTTWSW